MRHLSFVTASIVTAILAIASVVPTMQVGPAPAAPPAPTKTCCGSSGRTEGGVSRRGRHSSASCCWIMICCWIICCCTACRVR